MNHNTSNRQALIAAIRAQPANDELRLGLADHYEQAGDGERAHFIRIQTERAALPFWDDRVLDLDLDERAILAKRRDEWQAELPQVEGVCWGQFHRGLVRKVAFEDPGILRSEGERCISASGASSVMFLWPSFGERPKLGSIAGVHELTVVGTAMESEDVGWLSKNPLLNTVRELNLLDSELRTGFSRLLKSKQLKQLEALRIPLHHLGTAGVKTLGKALLAHLGELELAAGTVADWGSGRRYRTAIDEKGAYLLAAWPGLGQLRSLDLSGNALGVEGLRAIVGAPSTSGLRRLSVRNISDGEWDMDDSLTAFQYGPSGVLDELDISDNDLNGDAALALINAPALRSVKVLKLTNVNSSSLETLGQAPWLKTLRVLHCDARALPALLSRAPRSLHTLKVNPSPNEPALVPDGLATARNLSALRALYVDGSGLSDEELKRLAGIPALGDLTLLSATKARQFSDDCARGVAESAWGKKLRSIEFGIAGVDRLPSCPLIAVGRGRYQGTLRYL